MRIESIPLRNSHQQPLSTVEQRSLALHQAVAVKLQHDPAPTLAQAKRNLQHLRQVHSDGSSSPYFDTWEQFLSGPIDQLLAVLESPAQSARDLRSASPFAGVLTPHERQLILDRYSLQVQK